MPTYTQLPLWPAVKRSTTIEEVNKTTDELIELVAIQRAELLKVEEAIAELATVLGEIRNHVYVTTPKGMASTTSRTGTLGASASDE